MSEADKKSFRLSEWVAFSEKVFRHIREYTLPQYGDWPKDKLTNYNIEDCIKQIDKYADRNLGTNMRGRVEKKRDMLKIAHYACVALAKLDEEDQD